MRGLIRKLTVSVMATAVAISMLIAPSLDAQAAHEIKATVFGTVQKGTDASTLYLKTAQGDMIIKLDPDTESSCKLLIQGTEIYVGVYYGSDAYMHAATISASNTGTTASSDNKTYTVTGTIADKPVEDNVLFVNMGDDQMHLKLDANTSYNCGVLYAGKSITATIYRGTDAYMHAQSISDGAGGSVSSSSGATTSTYNGTAQTTAVTGKVGADSKNGKLYLESKDGTYELKLDSNTNYSGGYMLIAGKKITANIYRGDDAYMHVASTTRTGNLSNTSSGSTTLTFTGTVSGDSTDGVMYLKTSGGVVNIRLDANTSCNTPVYKGSTVSVNCVNCSDEYWHATSITVTK